MFRFIHTSDWHLGHSLYGYDRHDEQLAMLVAIAAICRRTRPDALLVSGDIYDSPQPPAWAQRMFTDAMVAIRHDCPEMAIIVTAGNHDSPTRHETAQSLWHELGIIMKGTLADDPAGMVVNVADRGIVIPVPYVNRRFMPEGYLDAALNAAARYHGGDSMPVVLMAHAAVDGCDYSGHDIFENGNIIGNLESIPPTVFADGFDYVALGHIHRRQTMDNGRICYSGSPMAIGFDEDYNHGVTLVSIDAKTAPPQSEHIDIEPLRQLVTLPSTHRFASFDELVEMTVAITDHDDIYLRLNLDASDPTFPPNGRHVINELLKNKKARFCTINRRMATPPGNDHVHNTPMGFGEFRMETPVSIATRYAAMIGEKFDTTLEEMLRQIVRNVNEESRL